MSVTSREMASSKSFAVSPSIVKIVQSVKSFRLFKSLLLICAVVFLAYSIVDFPSQTPVCLLIFSTVIGLAAKYSYLSQKKFKLH